MFKKLYNSKWFPRFFYKKWDGGKNSGVTGYSLIEWKVAFSIVLLHFREGSRENYHSHAFNACTWWLSGKVTEQVYAFGSKHCTFIKGEKDFQPSLKPKITERDKIHRIISHKDTWALTFRGPWQRTWFEITPKGNKIVLTHGRRVVKEAKLLG